MAIKILVVDDEPDIAVIFRQKFRRRINAGELEFSFAENGRLALQTLENDPEISLVFTDIRMPAMDGLTFLRELRALARQVLLSVVVSAYDDMPNIREAMRQGAWDFVTKPIDLDDLEQVLNASAAEVEQKFTAIRATQALAQAKTQRQLAIRSKELQQQFFENVTHELRTPLTLLLAPLESALGISSEAPVQAYLRQAKRGGHILLDLVNQLLDFAKVDAQMMQPQLRNVQVTALVSEIASLFQVVAAQHEIEFETAIAEGITGRIDPRMLGRILLNLLSNAFKFTPKGGNVRLELSYEERLTLCVSDTGSGFRATETEDVFSRFQPSEIEKNGSQIGTGLGLSICKAFIDLLGGQIELDSAPNSGSQFRVSLPMDKADLENASTSETFFESMVSHLMRSEENTSHVQHDEDKALVIVAEDHPDMRNYIVRLLQDDYAVIPTENGRIALEKAQELVPDLIVTDWMMPDMDGLALLEMIRHDRNTAHIPVVMLTAKAEVENRITGTETGAAAFVGKPFHPDELKAVIRNQLAQRELLRERFKSEMLRPDKFHSTSMEDQFLRDLKQVMEKNLMNEQFGVETMAEALSMSRRTLVRKLTAVTGEAPVKYIRGYRLERALQMLKDNAAPVWEIAVKTGFGSASYFTKCFKDHYGMSPKEAVHLN